MVSADLDELKAVNDREGHLAGNEMIHAAAVTRADRAMYASKKRREHQRT